VKSAVVRQVSLLLGKIADIGIASHQSSLIRGILSSNIPITVCGCTSLHQLDAEASKGPVDQLQNIINNSLSVSHELNHNEAVTFTSPGQWTINLEVPSDSVRQSGVAGTGEACFGFLHVERDTII
jgi:hypothetical protein